MKSLVAGGAVGWGCHFGVGEGDFEVFGNLYLGPGNGFFSPR